MTEEETDRIIADNKPVLVEMIGFWVWIQGLNKLLKWLAIFGIPFAVGIYGLTQLKKK